MRTVPKMSHAVVASAFVPGSGVRPSRDRPRAASLSAGAKNETMTTHRLFVLAVASACISFGCGSSDSPASPGAGGGAAGSAGAADAASDATSDAPLDAAMEGAPAFQVVEGCAQGDYLDATGGAADVSPWDTSLGKKCLKIALGQSVTWNGGAALSSSHPLEASSGDTPSPIASVDQVSPTVTFDAPGVFGFDCSIHLALMHGAVWVVP